MSGCLGGDFWTKTSSRILDRDESVGKNFWTNQVLSFEQTLGHEK